MSDNFDERQCAKPPPCKSVILALLKPDLRLLDKVVRSSNVSLLRSLKSGKRNPIEGTISQLGRATAYVEAVIGFAKVELQNLFIGTACNVKRWLLIVAETKTGFNIHFLPFKNGSYRIRHFFCALRLNSNSFSCPNQEAAFNRGPILVGSTATKLAWRLSLS